MKTTATLAAIAAAGLLAGCGFPKTGAAPPPLSPAAVTAASARWPGASEKTLASGRDLFVARCNGCHGYPDVASVPDDKWPEVMQRMQKKSDLTDAQRDEVLHFLLAAR